ncbi:MAG: AMP-binding protein [Clostridia bacterium]|nr:AMP-binding protein [Clostridia bacterium]
MLEKFINRIEYDSYEDFKANYAVNCPPDFNFATHVIDEWARTEPDRRALVWCNDDGESREFTFGEISELSKKAASYLVSLGIRKGDMVVTILRRRPEMWITAVALHRIGAVLIPANYQLAAKDLVYRFNSAHAKMVIAADDDWVIQQVEASAPQCPSVENLLLVGNKREGWIDYREGIANAKPDYTVNPDIKLTDPMLLYFTSGTSGMPKMVVHNYRYPLGHIVTAKYWQQVVDGGLHLTNADSGWAKFAWGLIYGQWISGTALLGYDQGNKFSAAKFLDVIRTFKPTTVCVPGTIYRFLIVEGLKKEDFASVVHCCTAGEPLAPEIITEFKEETGLEIHEGFGQSESSVLIANFQWFKPKYGSTGKPSPVYDLAICAEDGSECGVGDVGELVVRNAKKDSPFGLLCGYYDGEKIIDHCDENGRYHTGDLAWKDEDGHIWFVGRNDDMIKCSGYRIGPFEIESVLLSHPAVKECAITGAPDPLRGQVVKASIVLHKGYEGTDELTKELQTYVKKMTAPYKYPRIVCYMDALPKTVTGKINRKAIRNE